MGSEAQNTAPPIHRVKRDSRHVETICRCPSATSSDGPSVHCYFTGPFFLLMALIALSYGLGFLHLGGNGWNLLGLIALMGTVALWFLPESFLGKYRKGM